MPVTHLTDVVVSRLKTPGTYYDESTPAFAIRVGKNRKTWFVIRGRERERTNIGKYPALRVRVLDCSGIGASKFSYELFGCQLGF